MNTNSKVYVAGHRGLAGSAIVRALQAQGFSNIVTRTHQELDLTDPDEVRDFFRDERPDYVFLCAAKVGGIQAHLDFPVDFAVQNMLIQANVLQGAYKYTTAKLLFLGSACAYPKLAPVPIRESSLLHGPLEPSNEGYALAKIQGIKLCQAYRKQYGCNFISCMPTNLYGPGDNYDLKTSHVLPGMMHRIHLACSQSCPSVRLWGTGNPTREFLHSDDLASACLFLMDNYDSEELINVGYGSSIALKDLARRIAGVVGYEGEITWDPHKPDGTPDRRLNVSKLSGLGWNARTGLDEGIASVYRDFLCQRPH